MKRPYSTSIKATGNKPVRFFSETGCPCASFILSVINQQQRLPRFNRGIQRACLIGESMLRQAHHDTIVTLSLRRELSRTLVEGLDCPVPRLLPSRAGKPDNDKLVMTYVAVYRSLALQNKHGQLPSIRL